MRITVTRGIGRWWSGAARDTAADGHRDRRRDARVSGDCLRPKGSAPTSGGPAEPRSIDVGVKTLSTRTRSLACWRRRSRARTRRCFWTRTITVRRRAPAICSCTDRRTLVTPPITCAALPGITRAPFSSWPPNWHMLSSSVCSARRAACVERGVSHELAARDRAPRAGRWARAIGTGTPGPAHTSDVGGARGARRKRNAAR